MKLNILTFVLGSGFAITGIFAFVFPESFFALLGEYYGVFNNHFVKDAGIAFFSAGVLMLLSLSLSMWRVPLLLGGSLFVILHGLFHVQMLIAGMAPTTFDVGKELLVIITPSILTAILLILRIQEHAQHEQVNQGTDHDLK